MYKTVVWCTCKAVVFLILLFYRRSPFHPSPSPYQYFAHRLKYLYLAEITRRDLAISPTHSGVTSNLPAENFPYLVHNLWLFFTSQITSRRSGAIGQSLNNSISESHLIWRVTRKPVQTLGKPEIIRIYCLFLPEVILSHNYFFPLKQQIKGLEDFSNYFRSSFGTFGCSEVATLTSRSAEVARTLLISVIFGGISHITLKKFLSTH